jgi:2-keto-4-pentenoate hydratase/2-oxohepta-3-ene-1,7-dioic acid hydratase in catechol pathway
MCFRASRILRRIVYKRATRLLTTQQQGAARLMKLVRFGAVGAEKPGIVDADGKIRDLSAQVKDWGGDTLAPASLDKIRKLDASKLPLAPAGVRIGAPVARPWNFVAVGLNYVDHAKETGSPIPAEPILFNKAGNCIVGPNDDVMIPKGSKKLDWELEIAFVIGTRARYVEEKDAMRHIAGFAICNDVSERHFQAERSGQWMKGKSFETSGPLGPWLVTPDEIADVSNLPMWLDVSGTRRQTGNTSTMIFKIPFLLSYISQFMVLEAGDVVTTGTPPGVGLGMKPPRFLKAGDRLRLGIDGLGVQEQVVVASR